MRHGLEGEFERPALLPQIADAQMKAVDDRSKKEMASAA
jgi:hypothetical protein